jgi:hypothetical protein
VLRRCAIFQPSGVRTCRLSWWPNQTTRVSPSSWVRATPNIIVERARSPSMVIRGLSSMCSTDCGLCATTAPSISRIAARPFATFPVLISNSPSLAQSWAHASRSRASSSSP